MSDSSNIAGISTGWVVTGQTLLYNFPRAGGTFWAWYPVGEGGRTINDSLKAEVKAAGMMLKPVDKRATLLGPKDVGYNSNLGFNKGNSTTLAQVSDLKAAYG